MHSRAKGSSRPRLNSPTNFHPVRILRICAQNRPFASQELSDKTVHSAGDGRLSGLQESLVRVRILGAPECGPDIPGTEIASARGPMPNGRAAAGTARGAVGGLALVGTEAKAFSVDQAGGAEALGADLTAQPQI
jgi:hypothetical protein